MNGTRWTPEEDSLVFRRRVQGEKVRDIARSLGRTENCVRKRMQKRKIVYRSLRREEYRRLLATMDDVLVALAMKVGLKAVRKMKGKLKNGPQIDQGRSGSG